MRTKFCLLLSDTEYTSSAEFVSINEGEGTDLGNEAIIWFKNHSKIDVIGWKTIPCKYTIKYRVFLIQWDYFFPDCCCCSWAFIAWYSPSLNPTLCASFMYFSAHPVIHLLSSSSRFFDRNPCKNLMNLALRGLFFAVIRECKWRETYLSPAGLNTLLKAALDEEIIQPAFKNRSTQISSRFSQVIWIWARLQG